MHKQRSRWLTAAVFSLIIEGTFLYAGEVRMWQEDLVIPTWMIGPPEVNPTFSWSSSRQDVYPYPYKETLTDERTDKTYKACWLENEFIKVLILPEIGGRLHGARDKTNGYNFFYWQPTIKPALVGMTGAWISGGIEWNFPHGHRPTAFSPVQYRLVENPDGSKTVWVGEPELVQRMRWVVGLTVYPGRSVIEAKVMLLNSSPLRHSFQMWATTAVNANENYQAIFPTRLMSGHGEVEYFHWPVHEGVDISWWKNVPNASSFFAQEPGEFFGGYDHAKNAGTVITGNPDIVVGKKFWTWGTSPFGRMWEPILTEGEGPYLEPQAGAYSDNQPDYHWLEPGEVKSYSHFFYPVRDIGPFKKANVRGALNLEFSDDEVRIGVYSTGVLRSAQVRLTRAGETEFLKEIDIDPAAPYRHVLNIASASEQPEAFRLSLISPAGEELVAYSPSSLPALDLPEPAKVTPDPWELETGDELWHAGDIAYKFRRPERAREYFEEAVRRDPGDSRSRISLAELEIKKARYLSALDHLEVAEERDPDNGQLFYLRGIALEALGRHEEAYRNYYRSTHFEDHLARAYERVAAIDLRRGNAGRSASAVELALTKNALNPRLWALKATALRIGGDVRAAEGAAEHGLHLDPLSAWAANEYRLALKAQEKPDKQAAQLVRHLLHNTQTAIEAALDYAHAGLYREAFELLQEVESDALVSYYQAYFKDRMGQTEEAARLFALGKSQAVDYVFAFRREAIDVFETALKQDPGDGRAHYYLGLVFAKGADVERALEHWEEAIRLDPENPRARRNLGLALARSDREPQRALKSYEEAFRLAPEDSQILLELDRIKRRLETDSADRLAFLKQHLPTVEKRDALVATLVDLLIEQGAYQEALHHLQSQHFNSWEGNYSIHNAFMEVNVALAERASDPHEALEHYQRACQYPMNLEVAPREPNLRGFLYYPMAQLYKKVGQNSEATRLLEITAREASQYPNLGTFYRALALRELGQRGEADALLRQLQLEADALLTGTSEFYSRMSDEMQKALGHYYHSKVLEAKGEGAKAAESLMAAQVLEPRIEREAVMMAQRIYARAHQ